MLEGSADALGPFGEAAHVADCRALQLLLAARRRLAGNRLLEVGMYALVRVEIGTVWGQVVDLDVGPVLGQPILGQTGAVRLQPVQNEEDLPPRVADQALAEADEGRSVDGAVGDHPAQRPSVGHSRDQAQPGPLVADPHLRRAAARGEAAAAHVV